MLSLLLPAFRLSQLQQLLRAVARDAPLTDQVVRRPRVIGLTLIAWELLAGGDADSVMPRTHSTRHVKTSPSAA